jgi:hypothetical protein
MSNTESYTLVWLGTEENVSSDEVALITTKEDPRVKRATEYGLGWFCDTFSWDDEKGEPVYSLLVGNCLRILGYKEGNTEFRIEPVEVAHQTDSLREAFYRAGVRGAIRLLVLFHDGSEA